VGRNEKASRAFKPDSEAPSEVLFEKSPVAMWIFDPETSKVVAANQAASALYGYSQDEFLTRSVLDLCRENVDGSFHEAGNTGPVFCSLDRAATHVTSSGRVVRVLPSARRILYGGRTCVIVWSIEVAPTDQASAELRSTRIFLDAVVESIPSMVFVKDAVDGRFVLLNKAGEELLGLSRDDLIGKTDYDLFDIEDAQRFRAADQAVVASGKLVTIENEPLTTPEGIRSLRTQKIGVADANGEPRYLLGISEDVTERLEAEYRSRHLALHDVLTNLPNRLMFQNILDQQLHEANERSSDFAVMLLDLDGFKSVNDSLGHHAGDELLRQLATRMRLLIGRDNVLARLGGDEFGILHFGEVNAQTATALAQRLITAVAEPFEIEGQAVQVGCSIGIALNSRHGSGGGSLMKRADLALYAVKSVGKGGHAWFESAMEERADHQRVLRHELSTALVQGQLEIQYQPIVDAATGEIVCCEALLRWHHPVRGTVPPGEFIPIAEASGLIEPIGRWVLQQSCREAAHWPETVRVAVNLSARQFIGIDLAVDVMMALSNSGLAPIRLELEITESVLLVENEENVRVLKRLQDIGVRIALDDFGTGYSSLAYLRRVAFNKLKIDKSFISDLVSSPESLAIVRAIIGLGKSFNAIVTAEGVETDAQYQCLLREGCDQAQGFLFGRPQSGPDVRNLLTRPYFPFPYRIE
jgi:diguanylate cyclase (GGDEF)-like protein/PAS domain S-box-containing protein